MINWDTSYAAIWRPRSLKLRAVKQLDSITMNDLLGIKLQKKQIIANTKAFLDNKPCNNTLLWGARGTGKSSLIKAILNLYKDKNLRLIEFAKDDLLDLPEVIDEIRELPYKFIIYCDDLSFEDGDDSYKGLKPLLEGSIEVPPSNVLIYASSNRRHLVTEVHKDNDATKVNQTQIHYADSVEEKISLSDRFGLWLSFYQGTLKEYLEIVDSYFVNVNCQREQMHKEAVAFSTFRASRSGRCAKQFFNFYTSKERNDD